MSQFQTSPVQPTTEAGGNGLAIAALVCAVIGFIIPLVGIVGIILAIIAIAKPAAPGRGKGFAIGMLVLAIVATVFNCIGVMGGIMLPALGKARQAARDLKSVTQLQQVGIALGTYANANRDWFPESPDGLDRLVDAGLVAPESLVSPHAEGRTEPSYLYVPPTKPWSEYDRPEQTILAYQSPLIVRDKVAVLYMDGHVNLITVQELSQQLSAQGAPAAPQRQAP